MAELKIYRNSAVYATVHIAKDTVYQGQFMGENKIVANFSHPSFIDFSRGDYIIHKGKEWRLNEVPTENKTAKNKYQYNLIFEGREYTWYDKQLIHLGVSDFTFFGTPLEIIQLLVNSINEIDPGWIIGTVDNTADPQFFSFKDQSVRQALTTAAETFKMEFQFDNRTLNFRNTIGNVVAGVTLQYGKGNGLYSLTRQPAGNASVATRVYGYGGTQNIPADYRGGLTRLTFAERKVDNNIATYGIIETSVTFDDIIPERLAAITSTANPTTITDSTLDFDLNSVMVQGQAKIVFITGDLGGNEFLITDYNHATKTIKFEANKEESGYIIPNTTVKPSVGDQYKLVGITMPQTYITAAEARLKTETTNYANSIKNPPVAFGLAIDQLQAKANGLDVSLKLGDKLHTVDMDMGIDETLRVQAFSYPLINPAEITASISDKVTYTRAERIRQIIAQQQDSIREIIKGSAELQRISSIRREELQSLVFDPDGFFKTQNIRPLSIDTNMITVGSRSQEFTLSVIFKPNFNGDANRIDWTAGVLTHFTIADTVKTWTIATGNRTALVPASSYYIYARCAKVGTTGTIVFDTVQRKVDSDATYYYFLVGVLSSVIEGIRWPTLTYGTTEINGGFIRTGRIESNNGKAWLDLTNSKFYLGDSSKGLDWDVTTPGQLTIRGVVFADDVIVGGMPIIGGKLQVPLQKVTEAGAVTDRIITAKGLRANEILVIPSIQGAEVGSIWHSTGTGSDPVPPYVIPIASATILGGVKTGSGLTINASTGVLSVIATDLSNYYTKSQSDARYELSFSKNTAFNKNFGSLAGTVAQGNDSRIINGQTAFSWGDHKVFGIGVVGLSDIVRVNDLNSDISGTGIYGHSSSATGNPTSTQGTVWLGKDGNGWTSLIHMSSGDPELRFRRFNGTAWSNWKKVWHNENLTKLSDLTNDLGNYGNWITKAEGDTYYSGLSYNNLFTGNNEFYTLKNRFQSGLSTIGALLTSFDFNYRGTDNIAGLRLINYNTAGTSWSTIPSRYVAGIEIYVTNGGVNVTAMGINQLGVITANVRLNAPTIQATTELIIPTTPGTSINSIWSA